MDDGGGGIGLFIGVHLDSLSQIFDKRSTVSGTLGSATASVTCAATPHRQRQRGVEACERPAAGMVVALQRCQVLNQVGLIDAELDQS